MILMGTSRSRSSLACDIRSSFATPLRAVKRPSNCGGGVWSLNAARALDYAWRAQEIAHMPTSPRSIPLLAWLLVGLMCTASLRAAVRDEAHFFSEDAVRQANQTIDQIKRDYGR